MIGNFGWDGFWVALLSLVCPPFFAMIYHRQKWKLWQKAFQPVGYQGKEISRHQLHRATPSGKALWTCGLHLGVNPKIRVLTPEIIPSLIGFSIIFTIHFGGQIPLVLVQHPFDHHLFFTSFFSMPNLPFETNIHGVQQETTSLIGPVSHLKLDVT